MYIRQVKLYGFRNFKEATINFAEKSLIIGSNDIGKSNLIYALRILLDKSIPDTDLEPLDSDFYAYEDTNEILILIKFTNAEEDCIRAILGKSIDDSGNFCLGYHVKRDPLTKVKESKKFLIGTDENQLEEFNWRFYLKVLNLKYISSTRDLNIFIRKEKKHILEQARNKRNDDEKQNDESTLEKVGRTLKLANKRVGRLTYIIKATNDVNKELRELSLHNLSQDIAFDVCGTDISEFTNNLELVSQVNGNSLLVGGDGRNNQIFLALWSAKNGINQDKPDEISIYCIEEPEAHLHPHQQRKLADYLYKTLKNQVLISTHSPQIACEFSPNSIIRLYRNNLTTLAAKEGCCNIIEDSFTKFGYRLNVIQAEAFFSDLVFLVEGPSEVLFYKALASKIGVDLDRLNISILMVDGVGFEVYVNLLLALGIDFVIRTDNDIFKIPYKNEYTFAGIKRCIRLYTKYISQKTTNIDLSELTTNKSQLLSGFDTKIPPVENINIAGKFIKALELNNIFLSGKDLETDLKNSALSAKIREYFLDTDDSEIINEMQKKKATFMYQFLINNSEALDCLLDSNLSKPLLRCKEIVEAKYAE